MLTELQLKNFKAWRDTQPVKLVPVTMLLGTNSSGKSSLIQSLLLLKQTALSPDRSIHLNLGGDEVNDLSTSVTSITFSVRGLKATRVASS